MATYKGNKGNLLQHWVLCELVGAARRYSSCLQFIDAHAMAPIAKEQTGEDGVFDSVRARLPGHDSPYERAWNELVPRGETGYPNSASFVKRLWNGPLSMLLCEVDDATVGELRAWAGSDARIKLAHRDWRRRFEEGLPEPGLGALTLLSFDPYILSCHQPKQRDPAYMYPEDLDLIGKVVRDDRTDNLLIQLSTYSVNGNNSQPRVEECARGELEAVDLKQIAKVAVKGQMMSLVFARGLAWADELTSLNRRFQRWLNIAQLRSATSA